MRVFKKTCSLLWNDTCYVLKEVLLPYLGYVCALLVLLASMVGTLSLLMHYTSLSDAGMFLVIVAQSIILLGGGFWIHVACRKAKTMIIAENKNLINLINETR